MKKVRFSLLLFCLILFVDASTKGWVIENIRPMNLALGYPYGGIGVIELPFFSLSIVHTLNTGAAWSLLDNHPMILLFIRFLILAALAAYLLVARPKTYWPFVAIMAGACANILDTFLYGHVIDMIHCTFGSYSYPIFNVADSVIFCSIFFLLFKRKRHVSARL